MGEGQPSAGVRWGPASVPCLGTLTLPGVPKSYLEHRLRPSWSPIRTDPNLVYGEWWSPGNPPGLCVSVSEQPLSHLPEGQLDVGGGGYDVAREVFQRPHSDL